jgi:hypothetical protein
LTCVDQEIREKGFLLATLDREDDQYYPFVASLKSFAAIDGAEIGMTTITAWANAS